MEPYLYLPWEKNMLATLNVDTPSKGEACINILIMEEMQTRLFRLRHHAAPQGGPSEQVGNGEERGRKEVGAVSAG